MLKKFLPKEEKFFEMLSTHAVMIHEEAILLNEMITKFENFGEYKTKIHLLEHKCDEITHKISQELNETFITPIDREDIFALVDALDNVADSIDVIANRIFVYKVKNPIEFGPQLCDILLSQTKVIVDVVGNLNNKNKDMEKNLQSIRELESTADNIYYEALSHIFENEKDVVELIKKKEIYEILEKAIDRCQTVSIVVEGILIKNV